MLCGEGWGVDPQTFPNDGLGNFTSLPVLNKKIEVYLGWYASPLMGHVVSCKKLGDEGLHTLKGVIGYYMKDNGEEHFEFVHHNVLLEDMNDNKMEYEKFGKMGLNNRVSLSQSNGRVSA